MADTHGAIIILVEKVKSYGGLTVCYYISGIAQISAIVYSLLLRAAPPPIHIPFIAGIASSSIFPPWHTDQALFISGITSIVAEIYKFGGQ